MARQSDGDKWDSAAWREGFAQRIGEVVRAEGSQRKLARKVFGNPDRAKSVNEWCTRKHVPSAENLAQLRARCGVSLDWLACGSDLEEMKPAPGAWPVERRAKLSAELLEYVALLWDRHPLVAQLRSLAFGEGLAVHGKPRPRTAEAVMWALNVWPRATVLASERVRGDALGDFEEYFEVALGEAVGDAMRQADAVDAEHYRKEAVRRNRARLRAPARETSRKRR